jgi:PTH1 family peptidyl-tRNA hydrolase
LKLIFGLGNPGAKYDGTRHNIGFSILDDIVIDRNLKFSTVTPLFKSCHFTFSDEEIILIKPLTYMNLSGEAVLHFLSQYSEITSNDILIVYDDIHLPIGKMRFRPKGSDGGHNGIKNITYHLESDIYPRLRFGVGIPESDLIEHVLGHFDREDIDLLNDTIDKSIEGIYSWIENGLEKTMNVFNSVDLRPSLPENTENE